MSQKHHALVLALAAGLAATTLPAIAHEGAAGHAHAAPAAAAAAAIVADGKFGARTTEAVKAFQKSKGMKADGVAGPATLKALGLTAKRSLKQGLAGEDVRALQKALSAWEAKQKPAAKPAAKPSAKPTPMPMWTPAPTPMPTPAMPTPEPSATPVYEPWTPAPTEAPVSEEPTTWRPTVQLFFGDWMLPKTAGQYDFDFGFSKPAFLGGAAVWLGDWGLKAKYTTVPDLYVGSTLSAPGAGMYDAQLMWRCHADMNHFGIGYRGFGNTPTQLAGTNPPKNFGTLSYGLDLPLGTDILKLKLGALGATNFGPAWIADAHGGLGLVLGPVLLEAGYRGLWLGGFTAGQTVYTHAPFAQVGLQF